jgi:hypothetical protein
MNIIVHSKTSNMTKVLYDVSFIPRVGDTIDMFYYPLPIIHVVAYPTEETLKSLGCNISDKFDAIVLC